MQTAGRRIDDRRLRRIVEARIEVRDVVGGRVPGRPVDVAEPAFDRQRAGRLPRILHEHVGRERAPLREVALPELGVVVEEPQRHVRDARAGAAGAVVEELEAAVLVVRAARNGADVDLVEVVFTRIFDLQARLERVAALDPRRRVGDGVDRAARRRRIRTAVDLAEARDRDGRNLVEDFLFLEDVGIVDARSCCAGARRLP